MLKEFKITPTEEEIKRSVRDTVSEILKRQGIQMSTLGTQIVADGSMVSTLFDEGSSMMQASISKVNIHAPYLAQARHRFAPVCASGHLLPL